MPILWMNPEQIEQLAWRLFETRFLRDAESAEARQDIEERLTEKMAELDSMGRNFERLHRIVSEAAELWADRAHLRKRDVLYLAAALLYFICPLDVIPDVLPVLGYIDDVMVVSAVVALILQGLSSLGTRGKEQLELWMESGVK